MNNYYVRLVFDSGHEVGEMPITAPDDAMAIRQAIQYGGGICGGQGVAYVRHEFMPGIIKYPIYA